MIRQLVVIPLSFASSGKAVVLRVLVGCFYLICVICHLRCSVAVCISEVGVFTNPGAVPHNAIPLMDMVEEHSELLNRCGICDAFKPPKSHHCRYSLSHGAIRSTCNRCILLMDHHCPWINNCVGMGNMKFFIQFLVYTLLYCMLTIYCLLFFSFDKLPVSDGMIRTAWLLC